MYQLLRDTDAGQGDDEVWTRWGISLSLQQTENPLLTVSQHVCLPRTLHTHTCTHMQQNTATECIYSFFLVYTGLYCDSQIKFLFLPNMLMKLETVI